MCVCLPIVCARITEALLFYAIFWGFAVAGRIYEACKQRVGASKEESPATNGSVGAREMTDDDEPDH